jgi:hypothetical protein
MQLSLASVQWLTRQLLWLLRYSWHTVNCPALDAPNNDTLQRTRHEVQKYFLPIVLVHFESPKEGNLLTKDKDAHPKCPLLGDSTVRDVCTYMGTTLRTTVLQMFRNIQQKS